MPRYRCLGNSQRFDEDLASVTRRCDTAERKFAESEARSSALSESIQSMRQGLESEIATLNARCTNTDVLLAQAHSNVTSLTAELDVRTAFSLACLLTVFPCTHTLDTLYLYSWPRHSRSVVCDRVFAVGFVAFVALHIPCTGLPAVRRAREGHAGC